MCAAAETSFIDFPLGHVDRYMEDTRSDSLEFHFMSGITFPSSFEISHLLFFSIRVNIDVVDSVLVSAN